MTATVPSLLALGTLLLVGCQEGDGAPRLAEHGAEELARARVGEGEGPRAEGARGVRRRRVIDFHAHVSPTGLERIRHIMDDHGIEQVVNLSGGSGGRGLEASVALSGVEARLLHFYTPSWRDRHRPGFGGRAALRLEDAVKTHGFRGLKISKALGLYLADRRGKRVPVDWVELDPLWAKAGELGVPVAIHTGDPAAFWDPVTPLNERFDELAIHPRWSFAHPAYPPRLVLLEERNRVIARHPETTFVCVHVAGDPEHLEEVDALLDAYPNMMIDTSARLAELGRHPAAAVRAFFLEHRTRILFGTDLGVGGDHLMLGSGGEEPPTMDDVRPFYEAHWRFFETRDRDIPHPTPIQGDWSIDGIGLPADVLALVYRDNARRILGLKGAAASP